MAPVPFGDSALHRFARDVVALPGATDVIILEGVNDLNGSSALTAAQLTTGLRTLVVRAQRAGLRAHLATLTRPATTRPRAPAAPSGAASR